MSRQFIPNLCNGLIELLEEGTSYSDVIIEVGEETPNKKLFQTHSVILHYRSTYFRQALTNSTRNEGNEGNEYMLKFPNISGDIFQILLRYIYSGSLTIDSLKNLDIFHLLIAADDLDFHELVAHLQTYLLDTQERWLHQYFELVHRTSFQHDSFTQLQQFCTNIITQNPEIIFKSEDFNSINEKSLINLIQSDDLRMEEIQVWQNVLDWGIAQCSVSSSDINEWTDEDFETLGSRLAKCLPQIRLFHISSRDFYKNVRPFKKILRPRVYENLLEYFLERGSQPKSGYLPPRRGVIDSTLISSKHASLISSWIDHKSQCSKSPFGFSCYEICENPYEFELLLRGTRDGFSLAAFKKLCYNKPGTIVVMRVEGTDELVGGFNPKSWVPGEGAFEHSEDSFLFAFRESKGGMDARNITLSRVKHPTHALHLSADYGLSFGGGDLEMNGEYFNEENNVYSNNYEYEKGIREVGGKFTIDEYEVFQIVMKL